MAENEELVAEEEEDFYATWLEELETDPEVIEAEEKAERADVKAIKTVAAKVNELVERDNERTRAELRARFEAEADEEAKRLFTIYSANKDLDDQQLKALMQLAKTNSAEAKKTEEEIEARAEQKAEKIARDEYGASPIAPGSGSREVSPQQYFDQEREKIRTKGDTHAAFALWNALPADGGPTSPD